MYVNKCAHTHTCIKHNAGGSVRDARGVAARDCAVATAETAAVNRQTVGITRAVALVRLPSRCACWVGCGGCACV